MGFFLPLCRLVNHPCWRKNSAFKHKESHFPVHHSIEEKTKWLLVFTTCLQNSFYNWHCSMMWNENPSAYDGTAVYTAFNFISVSYYCQQCTFEDHFSYSPGILGSYWQWRPSSIIMFSHCYFRTYRNKVATYEFIPWPIEIRFCEPNNSTSQTKSPPRLAWFFWEILNGYGLLI